MRLQWKVVALVIGVVFITSTAIIWRTQHVVVEDKLSFVTDSMMKQLAPIKRLVDSKLADSQRELVRFAASRSVNGPGRETDFGPFDVIALVDADGSSKIPAPTWTERGASAKPDAWPAGHELTLLKSLPYGKVKDGQRYWVRVADAKGTAVFALLVSVEVKAKEEPAAPTAANLPDAVAHNAQPKVKGRAYIVGFTTQNPLASITEDFIGTITNVYVVDDRGYVAAHVDKSYDGALFTEDPIVSEIVKGKKTSDTGRFEDLQSRSVIGHFEKVDDSNLTAIIETPVKAAAMGSDDHLQTAIFTAIGVAFLAGVAAWFVGGLLPPPASGPVIDLGSSGLSSRVFDDEEDRKSPIMPTSSLYPEVAPPLAPPILHPLAEASAANLQNERKLAYEAFQQGLAQSMREPILSIIGHAQLIRANAEGNETIANHVDSLERDARSAKESLDRLRLFDETEMPLEANDTFDLDDVVTRALEAKDIDLQAAGITVERGLGASIPRLRGRAQDFMVALAHVIDNSIEAMRLRPVRRLTVKTEMKGDQAVLTIADTGIGMARDVKNRAFEPFFKNFESPMHMGLGLAYVHAAAHRADAKCEIESNPGDGTKLIMKFPTPVAAASIPVPPPLEEPPVVAAKPAVPPPISAPALPKVPPPSAPATSLTLGGRGPLQDASAAMPLPPMPYPKLDREEEVVAAPPEPVVAKEDDEDHDAFEPVASHKISVPPPPEENSAVSEVVDFETVALAPQPSAPEAVVVEPQGTLEEPPMAAPEPEPIPVEATVPSGPRPFRVRIRPPKTRGPNSQA